MKKIVPLLALIPFTVFSVLVVARHGYFGFLTLAFREPWALQMLLDLTIALFIVGGWMRRDARKLGIPVTPYLVTLPLLGSISALLYLVHRGLRSKSVPQHA
ncbi:Hypothetical protein A7982_01365 [Minicystis rosea]|nr:Hypothetical protein A7982_01365 [Minicystis rosea]